MCLNCIKLKMSLWTRLLNPYDQGLDIVGKICKGRLGFHSGIQLTCDATPHLSAYTCDIQCPNPDHKGLEV